MTGAALWFLVGSGLAAVLVAWRVRSVGVAIAVFAMALVLLWVVGRLGLGFSGKQVTPLITGAGFAAIALAMLLVAKRDAGWTLRLLAGVGVVLVSHAAYLWFALSLR